MVVRFVTLLACSTALTSSAWAVSMKVKTLVDSVDNASVGWSASATDATRFIDNESVFRADDQVEQGIEEAHGAAVMAVMDWETSDDDTDLLPEVFDWRNIQGKSYVAPVQDQGDCGACVAFAALTTLETQLNIARNTPYSPFRFSRQYFFSCNGGHCGEGLLLSQAPGYLVDTGAPDAACMDYLSGATGEDVPCSLGCEDAAERSQRIQGYERVTRGFVNIEKIKRAILRGPVLSSIVLYEDFLTYRSGVYRHVTGMNRGSHAITLIGWDDAKKAWIGRNSMGKNWGEQGDFYIAWDDVSLPGRYGYSFLVNEGEGYAAFENVAPGQAIRGEVPMTIYSAYEGTQHVAIYAVRQQHDIYSPDPAFRYVEASIDTNQPRPHVSTDGTFVRQPLEWRVSPVMDTSRLENGTYYIYSIVHHDNGKGMTQPVRVRVAN